MAGLEKKQCAPDQAVQPGVIRIIIFALVYDMYFFILLRLSALI